MEKGEPSYNCWWEGKMMQPLWEIVFLIKLWEVPIKLKDKLPYDPAIPLQGISPDKTTIQKDECTCNPMFTAALFTIAKT